MPDTALLDVQRQQLSSWVTLVARTVQRPGGTPQVYHSLSQSDYVAILSLTEDGRIPLVRQYRPAVEKATLELPAGLLDSGDSPAETAARELREEAGLIALAEPVLLATLLPDTGRLENRYWCFFARSRPEPAWRPEPGVERLLYSEAELRGAILDGSFDHALHLALIGLAVLRGHLRWPS